VPRLDHVTITATDFTAGLTFYDAVLGTLGWIRALEVGDEEEDDADVEVVSWVAAESDATLWLVSGAVATTGLHLAFAATSPEVVSAFYAAALAAGGTGHDAPRRWPIIRRGQFNAIVVDPNGNLIEAVAPE